MLPTPPAGQQTIAYHPDLSSKTVPTLSTGRKWLIVVVFCVFAGLIAETFVTTSTSPMDFLTRPFIVPFNIVLYGAFDLLAREIFVRRRAGLASVLLLGAAYGFINEGVAAGTWYVIHNTGYVIIGDVDWAWALVLTFFHTIISVLAPIVFIEILFPSVRGQSLLPRWGIVTCVVLLLGCMMIAIVVLVPQPLHIFFYRVTVLAVAALFCLVALALPSQREDSPASTPSPNLSTPAAAPTASATQSRALPGLWQLRIAGFLAMFAFFFLAMLFPIIVATLLQAQPGGLIIAQVIDSAVFLAFSAVVVGRGWTWSRRAGWSARQNLALLIGGVTFTTLLLNLTEAPMGEIFSTLPFYVLLIVLTLRWRRRAKAVPDAA